MGLVNQDIINVMAKAALGIGSDKTLMFWCPACQEHHGVPVEGERKWNWNGSLDSPTLTPSLLVRFGKGMSRVCHFHVTDGKLEYLTDCTHDFAGRTVNMEDFDTNPGT